MPRAIWSGAITFGIPGRSKMSKDELIEALTEAA
jgi:hypothetical protein